MRYRITILACIAFAISALTPSPMTAVAAGLSKPQLSTARQAETARHRAPIHRIHDSRYHGHSGYTGWHRAARVPKGHVRNAYGEIVPLPPETGERPWWTRSAYEDAWTRKMRMKIHNNQCTVLYRDYNPWDGTYRASNGKRMPCITENLLPWSTPPSER